MRWLTGLTDSRQVKDCLAALDAISADFDDEAAWAQLKPAVAAAIRKNDKHVSSKILRDGMLPRDVVLTSAANLALAALGSGQNHIHRGMLSMNGKSYRAIFSSIVSFQKLIGIISEEERNTALLNMADAVAEAG